MQGDTAATKVCVQGEGCIYQWVEHVREALATAGTEGADVSAGDACAANEAEAGVMIAGWCCWDLWCLIADCFSWTQGLAERGTQKEY